MSRQRLENIRQAFLADQTEFTIQPLGPRQAQNFFAIVFGILRAYWLLGLLGLLGFLGFYGLLGLTAAG